MSATAICAPSETNIAITYAAYPKDQWMENSLITLKTLLRNSCIRCQNRKIKQSRDYYSFYLILFIFYLFCFVCFELKLFLQLYYNYLSYSFFVMVFVVVVILLPFIHSDYFILYNREREREQLIRFTVFNMFSEERVLIQKIWIIYTILMFICFVFFCLFYI